MIILQSGSEHYQETDCPFGDSLMVMGEGFSQVDNDDDYVSDDSDEDVHDKGWTKGDMFPC